MEYIDLYDEQGKVVIERQPRDNPIPKGCWIMAVGIWLLNEEGKLLLTKRSPSKSFAPNLWENTGGHVVAGESGEDAVIRELEEETGITVSHKDIVFLGIGRHEPYFGKNYGVVKNFDLSAVRLQEGETCDVKAVSLDEFEKMANSGELAPSVVSHMQGYKESFFKFINRSLSI